jgi:hypothetical protein
MACCPEGGALMKHPATNAGRALLSSLKGSLFGGAGGRECILAIESEAHEQGRRDMDEALRQHTTSPEHYPPLEGREFGRIFGEVMKAHPKADARLVNDILRTVGASMQKPNAPLSPGAPINEPAA